MSSVDCIYKNSKSSNCFLLTTVRCHNCKFKKNAQEAKDAQKKANKRLLTLSANQQQYIADTYYNGIKKWEVEKGVGVPEW